MRFTLETYLNGEECKVYSLVASVPFSPLDLDLGLLARGQWDAMRDRFRFWYLPKAGGQNDDNPVCYLMIRKFDPEQDILVYLHIVVDLSAKVGEDNQSFFMLGILSNDDVRARSTLGTIFDIPPVFHRRSEVRLVEKRWRSDVEALTRFRANVYSVLAASRKTDDKLFTLNVTHSQDIFGKIKENVGEWW
jgi:hypothetical protein